MKKNRVKLGLKYVLLVVLAVIMLYPTFFMVVNSVESPTQVREKSAATRGLTEAPGDGFGLLPTTPTLSQYYGTLFKEPTYLMMFLNSLALAIPILVGQLLVAAMAAYAFAKTKLWGKNALFFIYILVMIMPFQVTLVANYITLDWMKLLDSRWAVIAPGVFGAFGVFVLRQFMSQVPDTYVEAARVDGAGHWRIFWKVVLPQVKGGLVAAGILIFIDNWNLVEQPLIFIKDTFLHPMSLLMTDVIQNHMDVAFACGVLFMIPTVLLYLRWQKHLNSGIQLSGIK